MVKKIFLYSFLLLVLYEIFLRTVSIDFPTGHHQWSQNVIKIEKYLFDDKEYNYALLGSSLSFYLLENNEISLYNMAFAGYSVYEGFALLKKSNKIPNTILIETNMVLREEDIKFTKPFFTFYGYFLRKNFRFFQTRYQPCSILTGLLKKKSKTSKENIAIAEESPVFQKFLEIQKKEYSKKINNSKVNKIFKKLKENIDSLEKLGKKIIFFEMPFHEELHNLEKHKILKEYFSKYFPQKKYLFFSPDRKYNTTDGVHLTPKELENYAHLLEQKLKTYK